MGTPTVAVPPLKALVAAGHQVVAVVSQPDRPKGRGRNVEHTEVKKAALELGLEVIQPQKATEPGFMKAIEELKADVAVVCAFGQKIPSAMLAMPKYGFINIHASMLPLYRGAAPVQRAIMDGRNSTGVTIMYMNEGMDEGDIGISREIPIHESDDSGSVLEKVASVGSELIVEMLRLLEVGKAPRMAQDGNLASLARKITRDDEGIDWAEEPDAIVAKIRALSPMPGARAFICSNEMKVLSAKAVSADEASSAGLPVPEPGLAFASHDCSIYASAKGGWVKLTTVKPSGGKAMDCKAFSRGRRLSGRIDLLCDIRNQNEVK